MKPALLTLDLETYYSRDYSLTKMTTEEYIRSPQFEAIGAAFKLNDEPTAWVAKPKLEKVLKQNDWSNKMVLCQNTAFDGAILGWHYGVQPLAWFDIMGMSRALFPHERSHSLKAQAERMHVGHKGDEVLRAIGKNYKDFGEAELAQYGAYCVNDVDLTHALFKKYMALGFPKIELQLIDLTLRMFIDPVLVLDESMLRNHLTEVQDRKQSLMESVRDMMLEKADPDYVHAIFSEGMAGIKKLLMSNEKFATLLRTFRIEPPMKISPATGRMTYAFAKSDEGFASLLEFPDERVQTLAACRIGSKSTLEETRTQRFIGMSQRGAFPVPLRYYGAHSGRWSGQDSVNLQNLPARGENANKIKKSMLAPPGHVVIDCDSSQIEARTLAWLAGQQDLLDAFTNKQDVYSIMAASIYGIPVDQVTTGSGSQRQVGKTVILGCFGPDTLVLTLRGWVPIIHVQATDMVWDGLRWVPHAGVVPQGEKDVWTKHGVSATSDHEILTERGWVEWSEVCENSQTLRSARAVASLLSLSGAHINPQAVGLWDGTLFANVHAGGLASFYVRTLSMVVALGATLAPKLRRILNGIGNMRAYARTKLSARGYSTESPPVFPDATIAAAKPLFTTEGEAFTYMSRGAPIGLRFLRICYLLKGTASKVSNLIGLTWIKAMSRAIFVSWGVRPTWQIDVASAQCRLGLQPLKQKMQTYDIAYAGRLNRYTILTTEGPIIVHNCGYGVGPNKLQLFLRTVAGVEVDLAEAKRIINTYRTTYSCIPALWQRAQDALRAMSMGNGAQIDSVGIVHAMPNNRLTLPNGLYIHYPDLTQTTINGNTEWSYMSKGHPIKIYGGKIVENFTQAVARCVVAEQMLRISKRYKVVLTVHDAVACVAPIEEAEEAKKFVEHWMSWQPAWAAGLPLACEAGMGVSYGDC